MALKGLLILSLGSLSIEFAWLFELTFIKPETSFSFWKFMFLRTLVFLKMTAPLEVYGEEEAVRILEGAAASIIKTQFV